ncbi:uncharacterized protein LOC132255653 isoform X2 [Phlebotomus argentipes]|uniref:uncharacterized protein LOC132255653 isoform X2 n=1 Tax=Phlebotomus argentipes TaxID=94469 RepID=UPI002892F3B4|nr:uncharacterized protein LOC132255653 isoform X2 [Phlebotomus argentipes]
MESPLEVLSRAAATMVQEKTPEAKLPNKELPTTKWRRERRRLSEYQTQSGAAMVKNGTTDGETPLDMSISAVGAKPRSPPPYREPLPGSTFALSLTRPTVITQAPKTQLRPDALSDHLPESISMCDTVIDEHFRRSLGNNYMTLFSKNYAKADIEEDAISLSVDDHFAKALGDTWQKIKATSDTTTANCSGKRRESDGDEEMDKEVKLEKADDDVQETSSSSSCSSQGTS